MTDKRPRHVVIHVGPTNSGKTYGAIQMLAKSKDGAYLAPLRLLAWEVYERLNNMECPADLLTGEEVQRIPGAKVTSATMEMFPRKRHEVVVVDEAQLVGDEDRGWAWTRALLGADTGELQVCCSPEGEGIVKRLLIDNGDEVEVQRHERMVPLRLERHATSLADLPDSSAVVAFSRLQVLRLKAEIERLHPGKRCAVIYGALPPDVRRAQARMVLNGDCDYVASTDAIGMGMNLPLDHVFFYDSRKYDGKWERRLTPSEVRQIAGRAGRFGLSDEGTFGGVSPEVHADIVKIASEKPDSITQAYIRPEYSDLEQFSGRLARKIWQWQSSIAPRLKKHFSATSFDDMLLLASNLPKDVEARSGERAFRLITAPVSDDTLSYWIECVRSGELLQPSEFRGDISGDEQLDRAEKALHEHELCLWLERLAHFDKTPDMPQIKSQRDKIAEAIHLAFASGMVFGRCSVCGRRMSPSSRFKMCERCYESQRSRDYLDEEF